MRWFRRKTETRAITALPWDTGGSLVAPPVTQDRALTLAPVFAANRHLGDSISTLPVHAYRKVDDRRLPMGNLPALFRQLEEDGELVDWLFTCMASLSIRGNSVGFITRRDRLDFPTAIEWLKMDDVHVDDATFPRSRWFWRGRPVNRSELVHIPWFKVPGRTLGLSPIEAYASTITAGLEAQRYGSDWFLSGGIPPGRFKNSEKTVSEADAEMVKGRLVSAIRAHKPLVYGADWDYEPITIPPEQAQFIESMNLTANQVAAIYGIAPEEVGGEAANSLTYANEEMRQTTRNANLRPWVVRLERKFTSWIPRAQYIRLNMDAVVRADVKSRWSVYQIAKTIGAMNVNEIRAKEDMPPIDGGETYVVPTSPTPAITRAWGPYDIEEPSHAPAH